MGWGKLNKENNPNRNEAYFCSKCGYFNDPYDRANYAVWKEMLTKNLCVSCRQLKGNLFEEAKPQGTKEQA